MELLAIFLETALRTALPLALAALGEMLVERTGTINIGLEGVIIAGAFGGMLGADAAGVGGGLAGAAVGGVIVALVFAAFVIGLGTDQIITGTAVTLLALGATGVLHRELHDVAGAALGVPVMRPLPLPVLAELPVVGRALFAQPVLAYLLYVLVPIVWWMLRSTHRGLALRAVGENPAAVRAAGISPAAMRLAAILVSGVLAGWSGGYLVLAQTGTFAEGMSAGRGFIAIAIVALGRWHPIGVALAALVFGAASAMQYLFQATGWNVPYQLFLALPYVLTLVALAGVAGRVTPPAALGRSDVEG
jgi:simple sugar transport system permease protein